MNKTHTRALLAALLCGGLLATGTAAQAKDHHGHGRHDWHPGHHVHDHHDHGHRHTVIRERVVVREHPLHYDAHVHHHHYAPPRAYSHAPAVVIGVNIPPLVIPLR